MARQLEEIWDGSFYSANDMARLGCGDCAGCSSCCRGMGDSVELDAYDFHRLAKGLSLPPEALLQKVCGLHVKEGLLLPHLQMTGEGEACVLLDTEGRCSVHSARPGFCRLFPLGRYYEEEGFRYFLQKDACEKKNRSKVKIRRWLGEEPIAAYEEWIRTWHYGLLELQFRIHERSDENYTREINLTLLRDLFLTPVKEETDIFEELSARLRRI